VGDLILLPDGADVDTAGEMVKVTAVNTVTNTLTVIRSAYGSMSAEAQTAGSPMTHSQADKQEGEAGLDYSTSTMDGGPQNDGIGDQCDTGSIAITVNSRPVTVNFGSAVSNGHWHARGNVIPICYSTAPVDADGDGYCAPGTVGCLAACLTDSAATDSGSCLGTVPPSCAQRHSAWGSGVLAPLGGFDTDRGGGDTVGANDGLALPSGGVVAMGTDGFDNDLDFVIDEAGEGSQQIACPGGVGDLCPETGFDSDWIETYTGTNPAQACAQDATANNEPFDSWIYDLNDNGTANLSDISIMGGAPYGKFVNQAGGSVRYDLNADGVTNLADVSILGGGPYGKTCRRDDGTVGGPQ